VKLPATQRTVKAKLKAKSIRLDVYVEDDHINISTLYELYKDGLLSLDNVLAKANMSEADFMEKAKKIEKEQAY
jgi:hypothetical protein